MPSAPRYFSSNAAIFGTPDLEARIRDNSIYTAGLAEAIIEGKPSDGGLFMPTYIPQIDMDKIMSMKDKPYSDFFVETMKLFFKDVLSEKTLDRIGKEAYRFKPYIEDVSRNDIIARLDEGPTAAFKDYAAQVFFRVIEALMTEEPQTEIEYRQNLREIELLMFILSTSGDTGSAMGVACHKKPKMSMLILHSSLDGQVSDLQAKQMDTLNHNIYVGRAPMDFDGCTKITNHLLEDSDLSYMKRNSANSINIGRLLPQITYYFYLYAKRAKKGEKIVVSVPCGNFGDLTAGLFAKKMGLPIDLIVGVNENKVFEGFYRTGIYKPFTESIHCPSVSMVVNKPSNTRRIVQLYGGQLIGDDLIVPPNFGELRKDIVAVYSVENEETHEIVKKYYDEWHMIGKRLHSTLEPHGAVAWGTSQKFRRDSGYDGKIITFETAHPGKFPESLQRDGITPELPGCLARLVGKPHGKYYEVSDYQAAKNLLINLYNKQLENQRKSGSN